jgi:hypothetical protein
MAPLGFGSAAIPAQSRYEAQSTKLVSEAQGVVVEMAAGMVIALIILAAIIVAVSE